MKIGMLERKGLTPKVTELILFEDKGIKYFDPNTVALRTDTVIISLTALDDESPFNEIIAYCENRKVAAKFLKVVHYDLKNYFDTDEKIFNSAYDMFVDDSYGKFVSVFVWDKNADKSNMHFVNSGYIPF